MKNGKIYKYMVACLAVCGLMMGGIAGAQAYMSSAEAAANTFTIGQVKIELDEPSYPGNNSPEVKQIAANTVIPKDPMITNTGVNDCIVFMSVSVPDAVVTVIDEADQSESTVKTSLFTLLDDTGNSMTGMDNGKWLFLRASDTDDITTYVYAYDEYLVPEQVTEPLFNSVKLKNVFEGMLDSKKSYNVDVTGYAIQADYMDGVAGFDKEDSMTRANLETIYNIYMNQVEAEKE